MAASQEVQARIASLLALRSALGFDDLGQRFWEALLQAALAIPAPMPVNGIFQVLFHYMAWGNRGWGRLRLKHPTFCPHGNVIHLIQYTLKLPQVRGTSDEVESRILTVLGEL